MSDLQADLSLFEGDVAPDPGSPLANIVEAARRVANALPLTAHSGRQTWAIAGEGDPLEGWLVGITEDEE